MTHRDKDAYNKHDKQHKSHCCEHEHSHEHKHHHDHEEDPHCCEHEHGHEHHHGHSHEHHHEHGSIKGTLIQVIVAIVFLVVARIVEHNCGLNNVALLFMYLIPYLIAGWHTLHETVESIAHGDLFNEHFLMTIATIGALCIGLLPNADTQFMEAVMVMIFFQVGEMFEEIAEGQSKRSISHLMEIRPDTANVERNGEIVSIKPEDIKVGDTLVLRPGDKIAVDARIIEGSTTVNTVAITGESVPHRADVGDDILSGCINLSGAVKAEVVK